MLRKPMIKHETPKLRETNRRLLMFYDALMLIVVRFATLVLHPSSPEPFSDDVGGGLRDINILEDLRICEEVMKRRER